MSPAARGLLAAAAAALALACGGGADAPPPGEASDTAEPPSAGSTDALPRAGADTPDARELPADAADPPAAEPPAAEPPSGAGGGGGEAIAGDSGPVTMTGTVRLTGTAEAPLLTLRSGDQTWLLSGEATAELGRLDGATVRVTGRPGGEPGRARPLAVTSYVLESIGGDAPFVGVVERGEGGQPVLATDAGTLRLTGAGGLADLVGARVWVLGGRSGDALSVGSYGVIRPPG